MRPQENSLLTSLGKATAKPLSHLFANSLTAGLSQLAETYLCILLGKGAGTGWAFDAEINAVKSRVNGAAPTIFDVGANVGDWSARVNALFPQSTIYMFEPQPDCQKSIVDRAIPGTVLVPHAVSRESGQSLTMHTSKEKTELASLYERRDSYFQGEEFSTIDVKTVSIDDFIKDNKISTVEFMKIDAEGHDLDVLKGALGALKNKTIKSLSFEFGCVNINSRTYFHDFWDLLTPLDYKLHRILPSSRLMPIDEYYEDCEYFRGVTNYLATAN